MDQATKIRENKARRAARRQKLELVKSRLRDPRAVGFGGYMLTNADKSVIVGTDFSLTLDDVEAWLITPPDKKR